MQALRLARPTRHLARRLTTAAASTPSASSSGGAGAPLAVPLSNVEAQWEKLTKADRETVQRQLEEIQKKDWKTLSVDEKKAGAFRFVALWFLFSFALAPTFGGFSGFRCLLAAFIVSAF